MQVGASGPRKDLKGPEQRRLCELSGLINHKSLSGQDPTEKDLLRGEAKVGITETIGTTKQKQEKVGERERERGKRRST